MLKDRVAIVTGGGRGIGATYANRLAREGAAVVVADIAEDVARQTATAICDDGGQAVAVRLDQADQASCEAMAEATLARFGRIDILVNNASLFGDLKRKSAWEISADEWDRVMAVNLRGPFLCSLAVLPAMRKAGYGKIVNISSSSIFQAKNQLAHYVASKMGVIGLTRALAREVGQFGITVNAIAPGSTDSGAPNISREMLQSRAGDRSISRVQVPSDLEGAVVFLASEASNFITGQLLVVDGGLYFY